MTDTRLMKTLVLPSTEEALMAAEKVIESLKAELDIREDAYGNLLVAVTEAVNNAVYHGNKAEASRMVTLTFRQLSPFRLEVMVKDEGNGFDYENLKDPTAPENLLQPGGRGVFLMKNLSEEVRFMDHGSTVCLTFHI